MMLRSCVDLISKQALWKRPFLVVRCQTSVCSTSSSLPLKPKRGKNPWVFFCLENLNKAKEDNPGTSVPKIFQLLSVKWQNLGPEAQKKYFKLSAEDHNRYSEEIQVYNASLTPGEISAIAEEKAKANLEKEKKREKKKLKALGIPKRPPNAYILFSMEFMKKEFSQTQEGLKYSVPNKARAVADAWSKLSVSERAKWDELAAVKAEEFKKKVEEWESDMTSKGCIEIVGNNKT